MYRPKRIGIVPGGFDHRIQCALWIWALYGAGHCVIGNDQRYRFPETKGIFEELPPKTHPPTKALEISPNTVKGVVYVDMSLAYMIRSNEICGVKMVGNNLMPQVTHCCNWPLLPENRRLVQDIVWYVNPRRGDLLNAINYFLGRAVYGVDFMHACCTEYTASLGAA